MPVPVVHILDSLDYERHVRGAADVLRGGGLVVLPTETVYGAAAVLGNSAARDRLKALRHSAEPKPLTPHLARREQAKEFLGPGSEFAGRMMRKLWPGPVGLQFDVDPQRREEVARQFGVAEGELYDAGSITLRCPDHPVFEDVAAAVDAPLVVTLAGGAAQLERGGPGRGTGGQGRPDLRRRPVAVLQAVDASCGSRATRTRSSGQGVYDERIIERLLRTTILFVCSGNTCRSPMAEAIARATAGGQAGRRRRSWRSKGISAFCRPAASPCPARGRRRRRWTR